MDIKEVHNLEKAVIQILNFDNWQLTWSGGSYEHYDAEGRTPKDKKCVVEMKFRNKYYQTKLLEKSKYDKLMSMDQDITKLYLVFDTRGYYIFWLDNMVMPKLETINCPSTTLWNTHKTKKEVYLLEEAQASYINTDGGIRRII